MTQIEHTGGPLDCETCHLDFCDEHEAEVLRKLEAFDEMLQALKDAKRIIEELRAPRDLSSFIVLVDIEEAIAKGEGRGE